MKHNKYSAEAVNLIAERMPDEFYRRFVRLWLGTDITLERLADELNYSERQMTRYIAKINKMIEQMTDIVNGDVKRGGVSMVDGHIDGSDTCVICGKDIPEGSQVCVICGDVPKKNTNYDRIRNMSVEEMAEFMSSVDTNSCGYCIGKCASMSCNDGFKNWLESEVTE